jgi:multidrug efflux pump subunit AcrB
MKDRLSLLAENAFQGLLIVFVLLTLFLNVRLAFWVAMGIPLSIGGTLVLMGDRFLGYSLNDITTFGMIIVLGILVDDAIVVGESVFETRRSVKDPIEGTIKGVHKVSTATIFGCFTSIAAFYPLLMIDNDLGKIFAGFSVVVITALLVSLFESKMILPAHLAAVSLEPRPGKPNPVARVWARVQGGFQGFLSAINRRIYRPLLKRALGHRYAVMVLFLTVAACGLSMINSGWIRTVFFPDVPGQIISVTMKMKSGSPVNLTTGNLHAIEAAAERINREAMEDPAIDAPPIVKIMSAMTGPGDV